MHLLVELLKFSVLLPLFSYILFRSPLDNLTFTSASILVRFFEDIIKYGVAASPFTVQSFVNFEVVSHVTQWHRLFFGFYEHLAVPQITQILQGDL